jgi:hypothetical protein
MAALYERRTGPRKVDLDETLAPATQWKPEPLRPACGSESESFPTSRAELEVFA